MADVEQSTRFCRNSHIEIEASEKSGSFAFNRDLARAPTTNRNLQGLGLNPEAETIFQKDLR